MMKNKMNLTSLKVESFMTEAPVKNANTVKGGLPFTDNIGCKETFYPGCVSNPVICYTNPAFC